MRNWVLELLRCPKCGARVAATPLELNSAGEVWAGILDCANDQCHTWYPVVHGIPRLLEESLRRAVTHDFVEKYGVNRPWEDPQPVPGANGLKTHTIRNFGYEWTKYDRFGWDDPVYNIKREKFVFHEKSLLEPSDFKDKLVLDAGCGNGRYSYWAAQYGARVIGIDLGDGVESAGKNTSALAGVQIVQADIFHLPFPDSCFDAIFSIGVLMHTGDAKTATRSLVAKLKQGGTLSVNLYGKGNPIYEWVDRRIRQRTTRMSVGRLEDFTRRAYALRRALERIGVADEISRFIRLDPHPHCIFDWYAAPIATHHTYVEVEQWFREMQLKNPIANDGYLRSQSTLRKWLHKYLGSSETVTIRGEAAKQCAE